MSESRDEQKDQTAEAEVEGGDDGVIQCRFTLPDGVVLSLPGGVVANDTADYIRNALQEIKETCHMTAFKLMVTNEAGEVLDEVNDFMELGEYLTEDTQKKVLHFAVQPAKYSMRSAREHIKRCRDLFKFPSYFSSAAVTNSNQDSDAAAEEEKTVESPSSASPEAPKLTAEELLTPRTDTLSNFYDELLARNGVPDPVCVPSKTKTDTTASTDDRPSDLLKSLSESGWNPVPSECHAQGDIMYLEVVTATEGVLQLTCRADGFFVNRSSRNTFDPRPALKASFHHDLFSTLLLALPALARAWEAQEEMVDAASKAARAPASLGSQGPLDVLATLVTQGRGDSYVQKLQWNTAPATVCGVVAHNKSYDVGRAIESASSRFGADLPGPPHDWNEDMQCARLVPGANLDQQILKSKIIYKTSVEFRAACEEGMKAIVDGHVTSFNPMDAAASQVFIFNGIFFSGAVDVTDTFKLASGETACHKYAGHDMKNQQYVQALGVEGLHTVMQCVMDYKGRRMTAQTVIPGVLSPTGNASRLLAGAVEPGARLRMKNEAWGLLADLGKKVNLGERTIPALPFASDEEAAALAKAAEKARFGMPDMGLEDPPSPILVDNEDEKVPMDSTTIPYVGGVETKLIKGSDGRTYVLELARISPRDANYVAKSKGGTGNIAEEKFSDIDSEAATAYLLRRELIDAYLRSKTELQQKEVQKQYIDSEKARKDTLDAAVEAAVAEAKEGAADEASAPLQAAYEAEQAKAVTSLMEELTAVQAASQAARDAFRMNPNVFFDGIAADTDSAVVAKDEEVARELASFLFNKVMPEMTTMIRTQEHMPLDGEALRTLMHNNGVNMRYLGHLAHLARAELTKDTNMALFEETMMIQRMAPYWRELLETEMIARSVKIYLHQLLKENQGARDCPAPTIASVLSAVLSGGAATGDSLTTPNTSAPDASDASPLSKGAKKNKKKKETKLKAAAAAAAAVGTALTGVADETAFGLPAPANFARDADAVIVAIDTIMKSRFSYSLLECRQDITYECCPESKAKEEWKLDYKKYAEMCAGAAGPLGDRLNRNRVLRRICQQSAIRVATRDYTWSGVDAASTCVRAGDIMQLSIRTKTCEPMVPSVEALNLLAEGDKKCRERDLGGAYASVEQAIQILTSIVGPVHRTIALAHESLSNVLRMANDVATAAAVQQKNLLTWVQLHGLDSTEAASVHLQLAELHMAAGNFNKVVPHIMSARYIIELLGGMNHPLMIEVVQKGADYISQMPDRDISAMYTLLCYARDQSLSVVNACYFRVMVAAILRVSGQFEKAIAEMKHSYSQLLSIYGEDDPRVKEAKEKHLEYVREFTTLKVQSQKDYEAQITEMKKRELLRLQEAAARKQADALKAQGELTKGKKGKKGRGSSQRKHTAFG